MKQFLTTAMIAISGLFATANAQQHHSSHHASEAPKPAEAASDVRIGDPWPLDTCVVSGMKLGSMGDPIVSLHEGREVRFCCEGCVDVFEANPTFYLDKADAKIIEQQKAHYPLDYCIIDTAEAIEEDESKNSYSVVGNRLFIYCCPPCDKPVRAEPAKYIAKLDAAVIEKQEADYPLTTCAVSGMPLDSMGGAVNVVVANQLVKLCCAGCKGKVEKDPAGTLAKVAEARKAVVTTEDN